MLIKFRYGGVHLYMVVDIEVDKLSNMVVDLEVDKMAYMVVDNGHGG